MNAIIVCLNVGDGRMADHEYVDGGGWISDDSDFYGSKELRDKLERQSNGSLKRKLEIRHAPSSVKKARLDSSATENIRSALPPIPKPSGNVLDFLKSRPQVAKMQSSNAKSAEKLNERPEPARHLSGREADDLVEYNHFEGCAGAWQHHESIDDFLKRLPVANPGTQTTDGWIWVASAKIKRSHLKQDGKSDPAAFKQGGFDLLAAFDSKRAQIERENPGKAPATITRYLRPYREQLEDDLHALAVKTGTTCGKWLLFPKDDTLSRTWRLVAEATAEGRLGHTSKCATYDPNNTQDERVICVYTYDFTDNADVRRVLEALADVGLVTGAWGIYYKCDAYTYLDIKSNNPYRLKASMYSSKELLGGHARAKKEGPIVRATPAGVGDAWEF